MKPSPLLALLVKRYASLPACVSAFDKTLCYDFCEIKKTKTDMLIYLVSF
jgi:hypothetical protein